MEGLFGVTHWAKLSRWKYDLAHDGHGWLGENL